MPGTHHKVRRVLCLPHWLCLLLLAFIYLSRCGGTLEGEPPISICMPIYNRTSMLLGLISNLAQSDSQVALRVLDYGSPDLVDDVPELEDKELQLYADSRVRERLVDLLRVRYEDTGKVGSKEEKNTLDFVKNKKTLDIRFAKRNLLGKFSKAGGLNQIFSTVPSDNIIVILDVDMRVPISYFLSSIRDKVRKRKMSLLFSF